MMEIEKFVILGKEVELPGSISTDDVPRWLTILEEVNPSLAAEVEGKEVATRIEGNTLVVYRQDAVYG